MPSGSRSAGRGRWLPQRELRPRHLSAHDRRSRANSLRFGAVIVVRLQGGLGNQMFVYATGRSLAERHRTEFVLDASWMAPHKGGGSVRYALGCFDLAERVCPVWEVARVPNPSRLVYALQRLRPSRRRFFHVISESRSTNAFVPGVLTAPDDTYLRGYWQFEEYFVEHEPLIRRVFRFPPLSVEGERIADVIRTSPAVSVHVRRGDYVGHDRLAFLDEAYYRRAVGTIADAIGEVSLFVFSDDPEWCAKKLRLAYPTTIVQRSLPTGGVWEDMQLMSLCQHHVIANSTYSWWGAWLNPSPSKLVVAPKHWVRSEKRAGDPVPERWIRV